MLSSQITADHSQEFFNLVQISSHPTPALSAQRIIPKSWSHLPALFPSPTQQVATPRKFHLHPLIQIPVQKDPNTHAPRVKTTENDAIHHPQSLRHQMEPIRTHENP
jgi:hypothetical protein